MFNQLIYHNLQRIFSCFSILRIIGILPFEPVGGQVRAHLAALPRTKHVVVEVVYPRVR